MGANIAGIYGAQIFRSDDKPRYRRAFGVNIAVLVIGLSLAVVRYVDDWSRRRRNARKANTDLSSESSKQNGEKLPVALPSDVLPQTVLVEKNLTPVVVTDPVK